MVAQIGLDHGNMAIATPCRVQVRHCL